MKVANHKNLSNRVKRIEGQIRGISTMIEEDKYCIDILTQIKASRSALKSLELEVLSAHLNHCVKETIREGSEQESDEMISEIVDLLKRVSKS